MTDPVKKARRSRKQSALERLKLAYRRFWNAEATPEDQRLVLADLAGFCNWNRDLYQGGRHSEQDHLLGQLRVFLRIQNLAGVVSPFGRAVGPENPGDEEDSRAGQLRLTGE